MVAALLFAAATAVAPHSSRAYDTGNTLYANCTATSGDGYAICAGYITGVVDTNLAVFNGQKGTLCIPNGVAIQQNIDVVKNYLRAHPERRHMTAASLVLYALQRAYPC